MFLHKQVFNVRNIGSKIALQVEKWDNRPDTALYPYPLPLSIQLKEITGVKEAQFHTKCRQYTNGYRFLQTTENNELYNYIRIEFGFMWKVWGVFLVEIQLLPG
jgi:hypothetical protein